MARRNAADARASDSIPSPSLPKRSWKEFAFSDYNEVIAYELRYAIRRYNAVWESVLCKEPFEQPRYLVLIEQHRLSVIVLTCVFIEAVINFYLCSRCTTEEFKKMDRSLSLEKKWTEGPRCFVKNHRWPMDDAVTKDLRETIQRRNAIVHSKPAISIDGDNRHKGNEPTVVLDEHSFVARCTSLPERLLEQALRLDGESYQELSWLLQHCGAVSGQFRKGQYAIDCLPSVPEDLIEAVMAEGHNREMAKRCAAWILRFELRDADGKLQIEKVKKEVGRLFTLRLFNDRMRLGTLD